MGGECFASCSGLDDTWWSTAFLAEKTRISMRFAFLTGSWQERLIVACLMAGLFLFYADVLPEHLLSSF
ncbi:hypothetical protein D791_02394 [Nitrincola nitratireducens]|uniref:Uncharacterized protein n=1 Tax=Nitrincola nitratireducens TaxID=1229521 RepID=W9UTK3_9GAMM|nr:hypothetical protein D791_02394 [Nitrincola nitratireducens]